MTVMSRKGFVSFPGTPVGVWWVVDGICAATGMRVVQRTDDYLLGDLGSQAALRLKGAMFCKPEEFPIKVEVRLAARGESVTDVWVEVRDDFGFGIKTGIRKRYRQAIDVRMADYVRGLGVVDTDW